jgi:hypothetical protein
MPRPHTSRRRAAALLLAALMASPSAAAGERAGQMLDSVWAQPMAQAPASLGFVDFVALYATTGFQREGWRQRDRPAMEDQEKLMVDALKRIYTDLPYLPYILVGGEQWTSWLGFDVTDVDWAVSVGEPPTRLLYLGLAEPPVAAIEAAFAARGAERSEHDGVTFFARGEEGRLDMKNRQPGYPFGGEIGQSERVALLPHALLGSSSTELTAQAATGEALAGDAAAAALVHAAADAGEGAALLQFTLLADDFSPDYVKALLPAGSSIEEAKAKLEEQAPGPLPAFRLALFADRQTAAGEEALVALWYDDPAAAAVAAQTLPARLAVYQPAKRADPLQAVMMASVEARVIEAAGGAIALLRLAPDAARWRADTPPGFIYRTLMRSWFARDLGWLTWK